VSVRAVVFDWGGTLSLPLPDELFDLWRVAAAHLDPAHVDALTERLVAVEAEVWALTTTTQRSARLEDILVRAGRDLGLGVRRAVIDEAALQHLDAWTPHIGHDPDAVGVLEALRNLGIARGLLSNTHWPPAFHERFLARDGLTELLDVRCYTSGMARVKPHPSVFHEVLDQLGADPAEAVFVGDNPHDDIRGASGVGMRTVLRRHPGRKQVGPAADAEIDGLPELLDLLRAWA